MSKTQKYIFEIPILILLIWTWQSLELSVLRLPFGSGSLQVIPVIITYVALTRSWAMTTILSLVFLLVQSFNVGVSENAFIAVGLWGALFTKLFTLEFTVEGRQQFTLLAGGAHGFNKIALYLVLRYQEHALPFAQELKAMIVSFLGVLLLAYFVFPILVKWDEYFEHQLADSRDLNPDILR